MKIWWKILRIIVKYFQLLPSNNLLPSTVAKTRCVIQIRKYKITIDTLTICVLNIFASDLPVIPIRQMEGKHFHSKISNKPAQDRGHNLPMNSSPLHNL